MIATRPRLLALAYIICVGTAAAQTSTLQELQNKLLKYEESSQKTIAELKPQIAALQQAQKASAASPASLLAFSLAQLLYLGAAEAGPNRLNKNDQVIYSSKSVGQLLQQSRRDQIEEYIVEFENEEKAKEGVAFANRLRLPQAERAIDNVLSHLSSGKRPVAQSSLQIFDDSPLRRWVKIRATQKDLASLRNGASIRHIEKNVRFHYEPTKSSRQEPRASTALPGLPNDPYLNYQTNLPSSAFSQIWNEVKDTSRSDLIFVIDTKVDDSHEDLAIPPSIQFFKANSDMVHASFVSGIIGAVGDNGIGITGINQKSRIISFQACGDEDAGCPLSDVANAIAYSADFEKDNPAKRVVNLSFGGPYLSFAMIEAVAYAQSKDVLIIAAAGNDNNDATLSYPGALPGVVSVASVDYSGYLSSFTNFGENTIAAIGEDIFSTLPKEDLVDSSVITYGGGYGRLSGTSFSTPQVVGVAALARTLWPDAPQYAISQLLRDSAIQKTLNASDYFIMDPLKMLSLAQSRTVTVYSRSNPFPAQAQVDASSLSYTPRNGFLHVEGNAEEHDAGGQTTIRWFVSLDDPLQPGSAFAASKVRTCDGRLVCRAQNFSTDLYFTPYQDVYVPATEKFPSFYLSGFIEDLDESGNLASLNPITFSDGSTSLDVTRLVHN